MEECREEEVKSRSDGERDEQGGEKRDWRGGGEHPIRS